MRARRSWSGAGPQSGESIVKAPKHDAEGVTIKPLESRSATASWAERRAPGFKMPAVGGGRPPHPRPLGKPNLKPPAPPAPPPAGPDPRPAPSPPPGGEQGGG